MKKLLVVAGLAILAACGGKGPQYIREPQVKTCTCEKCVCTHCVRDAGAICYCADKNKENQKACSCGTASNKTCKCDHCVGYPQGQCPCGKK